MRKGVTSQYCIATVLLMVLLPFAQAQIANKQPVIITIATSNTAQTIQHIGASGCWFSEGIGKNWPAEKKERIAQLLFSKEMGQAGNPVGIGLSAFRFNIGGGTAEQGIAGGIKDENHRVECFLSSDGTYDWSKQAGYQWFLRKAKEYGVENLIAFSNTPPVHFTKNGLGFKTEKDYKTNLKPEAYPAYAAFLAEVLKHFDKAGLHFNFISPVNEPQWDWTGTIGNAKQEGTPWTNDEIYNVVRNLDSALIAGKSQTRISAPEAAMLTFLYGDKTTASKQIQTFFSDTSRLNFSRFKLMPRVVAAHSYFTDANDSNLVNTRKKLADTARKYGVDFWQSEYSMLGNGYKEGAREKRSQMDCALFLAKVIHQDLTVANASAWHLWNAYEPGGAEYDTRYYLIALKPDSGFLNGSFTVTKNLWGLGHYSRFIRPGMHRLNLTRSDNMSDLEAAQKLMVSAYKDQKGKVVVVAINYSTQDEALQLKLAKAGRVKSIHGYLTTASEGDNMRAFVIKNLNDDLVFPPRSITTVVID